MVMLTLVPYGFPALGQGTKPNLPLRNDRLSSKESALMWSAADPIRLKSSGTSAQFLVAWQDRQGGVVSMKRHGHQGSDVRIIQAAAVHDLEEVEEPYHLQHIANLQRNIAQP